MTNVARGPLEQRSGLESAEAPASGARALAGRRTVLASISRDGQDGVSHVARLLHAALSDLADRRPRTIDLEPSSPEGVALGERVRFAARLLAAQLPRRGDCVLFSHLGLSRAQRAVPAPLRRPYGVFLHGVEVWDEPLDASDIAALRSAAVRISNSPFTARRVTELYPQLAPVHPCPLALFPAQPSPSSQGDDALLAAVRPRSALIVGRMSASERYKGHDQLIEAWAGVMARVPGAQLVIAGTGDDLPRLRAKAASIGLASDVLFCGRVSDATLAALYERSTLFAMPSRGEGFGIVYLEAMRAGRPCVASTADGARDVVVDGETGLLVSPWDRAALTDAVAALLGDPSRAAMLGAAGRRRYEASFTYEHFRDRLAAILAPVFVPRQGGRS